MTLKYTPGPWTYSKNERWGDTRFYIAQQEGAEYTPDYSDVATLICETCSGERVVIQEANAKLIAAAPELFTALKEIIFMQHHPLGRSASIEHAQKIIEKLKND